MNKTFTKLKCTALAAAALTAFCALPASAQLNYRATSATNLITTYTDLGTNGTAITTANNDNADSAPQNIGFTFNYNGQAYTQFVLNTNGYIILGSTGSTSPTIFSNLWATAANPDVIAPASGVDLQAAANQTTNLTEYRVATTGTAPNRVTTIQWENVADKATGTIPAQFNTMQFQVKLYETTNNIEFVYGTWTANTATPTGQPFLVGLKGTTGAEADRLFASKSSSATAWSTTIFDTKVVQAGVTYLASHFVRNTFLPDPGRTYRFAPVNIPANDMAVQAIFVQGKMALNGGGPQVIQALVKNTGSAVINNRAITLSISGNTFTNTVTLGTLAVGQDSLISFAPFTPTTIGSNNFVEVTVPTDGDNTNNSQDANIVVTANTQGYAQYPTTPTTPIPVQTALSGVYPTTAPSPSTRNANFLVRFTSTGRTRVTTVRAYVPGPAFNAIVNTPGATVYGIVFDATGSEVSRSANVVLTATDVDNLVTFNLTTPATFENGDVYYVGMGLPAQSVGTPAATIYAMGVQLEQNGMVRPNTFFVSPVASTTPTAPVDFEDEYRFVIEADIVDVTGVKEELNAKLVSVYPNPSNGVFKVSAKDMKGGNNVSMEVRDMQGKLVYSATAAKTDATLKLNNLSAGVYMLHVTSDAQVAVKRLVIQ